MPKLTDEAIHQLASQLADIIVEATRSKPVAFLVWADDMKKVMLLLHKAKQFEANPDRQRIKTKEVVDVLTSMWDEAKLINAEDMDILLHGIDLAQKEAKAYEDGAKEFAT